MRPLEGSFIHTTTSTIKRTQRLLPVRGVDGYGCEVRYAVARVENTNFCIVRILLKKSADWLLVS
ncbi:hypothetical protein RUM8411_04354 [Ruegeria meonggei]|uniref:Uncharacterized protein n=1 Tax=Ruegeria meonggei TaxID=1446476 RepID=A0A1X7ACG9_9RHOB|nr:hypothetical protein RUM8411_04354 [Ruegeria meonggei]